MSFGKLLGQIVSAPIKAVVSLPQVASDVIDEVGKALDGEKLKR